MCVCVCDSLTAAETICAEMPFSRLCRRTDPWTVGFRSTVLLFLHVRTQTHKHRTHVQKETVPILLPCTCCDKKVCVNSKLYWVSVLFVWLRVTSSWGCSRVRMCICICWCMCCFGYCSSTCEQSSTFWPENYPNVNEVLEIKLTEEKIYNLEHMTMLS